MTKQNLEIGLGLFATTNSSISSNTTAGNGSASKPGAGFYADSGSSGNTFSGNAATSTSYVYDCQDDSHGGGTAGTANTWTGNTGVTSKPAGLCSPPPFGAAKADAPRFAPRAVAPLKG